jgi:PleD family two-component response regulator
MVVTASIGVTAAFAPATASTMMRRADGYLYQSERAGRSRVTDDILVPPP